MIPVNEFNRHISRRNLIYGGIAIGTMALFTPGVFAELLDDTPPVEEGPFYPYHRLPLNPDNDLIVPINVVDPSIGVVTHLGGKIMDENGDPLKNCTVEIWQCDATGTYLAQGDDHRDKLVALAAKLDSEIAAAGGNRDGGPGFGGPPMFVPGQVIPPFAIDALNLSAGQKQQIDALQAQVKQKLAAILSPEQMKQLEQGGPAPRGF